jgi:hypothetical protein
MKMEHYSVFPDKPITGGGLLARKFSDIGIERFLEACRYVHELPYGYNSDRDDLMILFREKMGSCATKHAVIATLAAELGCGIFKYIGIYPMTEELVTGTQKILSRYELPYVPMVHCFLVNEKKRVDLSQGNQNGKNGPIDEFLYTEKVEPLISVKAEYLLYRRALQDHILTRPEMEATDMKTILKAREDGLALLRANIL